MGITNASQEELSRFWREVLMELFKAQIRENSTNIGGLDRVKSVCTETFRRIDFGNLKVSPSDTETRIEDWDWYDIANLAMQFGSFLAMNEIVLNPEFHVDDETPQEDH